MNTIDAILPAGGTFTTESGESQYKALLALGGRSLLSIAEDGLRESGLVRRLVSIGPPEVLEASTADLRLEPGSSGPDNMYRGLEALLAQPEPPDKVLICTTDMPFLTGEVVKEFLKRVRPEVDLTLPIIRKESYFAKYPGAPATFVKIKEGSFTLGGLFFLDARALIASRPYIEAVFAARKSQLKLAKLFGPKILFKFLTGRLELKETEATATRIVNCSAATMADAPAELAYDIDDASEYAYALKLLEKP